MKRSEFLSAIGLGGAALYFSSSASAAPGRPPNVVLFTADDLNCDSLGCFGSKVPGASPNLDAFAKEAMRFTRGHVTVAICQPSRGVLATGKFPHNSGVMGFMHTTRDIPTVTQTLQDAGYLTGILGKVKHSTPKIDFKWDFSHDQKELGNGRSPKLYYDYCKEFLGRCRDEGKPFYFMVNSHDPHRPYHIPEKFKPKEGGAEEPSKLFSDEEVDVPGFLPDLPGVRAEVATYFNSVRRLDDTFGRVMQALEETGFKDNTIVTFLSDNGIAMPFAKCNAYLASTNTPWMVRWPGVVKGGSVDKKHFISGIDFMPTTLEAVGLPEADGMDGVSYLPLLKGEKQDGRDHVHTQIDSKAGNGSTPMRCVQNARYGYIFNAFSHPDFWYRNNNEGLTMKAMVEAGKTDEAIAARVDLFRHRVLEELYDLEKDPDCLVNLIDNPEHAAPLADMQKQMEEWMVETGDPLVKAFRVRDSQEQLLAEFNAAYPNRKIERPPGEQKASKDKTRRKSGKNKKK